MKKAVICVIVLVLLMRAAVVAGAGEVLAGWVQELGVDERLVTAALNLEMGGVTAPSSPDETQPSAASDASVPESDAPRPAPPAAAQRPQVEDSRSAEGQPGPTEAPAVVPTPEIAPLAREADMIHNRSAQTVDLDVLSAEGLSLRLSPGKPQVLIIHTHSSEAYTQDPYDPYTPSDPYRTEDKSYSVIRVGDALAEHLEAQGLYVLHDRELYDYPSYTGSYTRSGNAVERYLSDYPSLRVVIDLHRDAIGSGDTVYKTQAAFNGRTSAQVMLLVGTGENGLYHPNWKENLKLAIYLQNAAEQIYPTLMRPIELVSERYNQQLSAGSLLIEVGSTGNTLAEAVLAAELFGDTAGAALARLIDGS